jgi:hypothetical protein
MDKIFYVVFWSPMQMGSFYIKCENPLSPDFLKEFCSKMATKLSFAGQVFIPAEAVCVTNVIELSDEVAKEVEDKKLVKSLFTL